MADSTTNVGQDGSLPVVSSITGDHGPTIGVQSFLTEEGTKSLENDEGQEIHILIYKNADSSQKMASQSSIVRMPSAKPLTSGQTNSTCGSEGKSAFKLGQGKSSVKIGQAKARGITKRGGTAVGPLPHRSDTARLNAVKENVVTGDNNWGSIFQAGLNEEQKRLSAVHTVPTLKDREPLTQQPTAKRKQYGVNSVNPSGATSPSYPMSLSKNFSKPMAASTPISKPWLSNILSSKFCQERECAEPLEASEQMQGDAASSQPKHCDNSPSFPLSTAQQSSSWSVNMSKSTTGSFVSPAQNSPVFSSTIASLSPLSFTSSCRTSVESQLPSYSANAPGVSKVVTLSQHAPEQHPVSKSGTSLDQTPDSGIGFSFRSSAQTQLAEDLESEFGVTCSSWATSDDSNQMLPDLPVTNHESMDENSNSQGEDSEMNRSLTGMVWLKDYALKKPKASSSESQLPEEHVNRRLESRHNRNLCVCNPSNANDEHDQKPAYKYKTLIEMALLSRPDYTMMSCEIREWLMQNFEFFKRHENCAFWKNAVRHNLSSNDCFVKNKIKKRHWTLDLNLCRRADSKDTGLGSTACQIGNPGRQRSMFPEPVVLKSLGHPMVFAPNQLTSNDGKLAYQPILPRPAIPSQIALLNVNQLPPSFLYQQPSLVLHIPSPGPAEIHCGVAPRASVAVPAVAPKLPITPVQGTGSKKKANVCTSSKEKKEGGRTANRLKRTKSAGASSGNNVLLQAAIESGLTVNVEKTQHREGTLISETDASDAVQVDSNSSHTVNDGKQTGNDGQRSLMKRSMSTPAILAKRGKSSCPTVLPTQPPEETFPSVKPKVQSRTRRKQRFTPTRKKLSGVTGTDAKVDNSQSNAVSHEDLCALFSQTASCASMPSNHPKTVPQDQAGSSSSSHLESQRTCLLSSPEQSNPTPVQGVMGSPSSSHPVLLDSSTPAGKLRVRKESLPSPISSDLPCLVDPAPTDSSLMLDDISAILTQAAPLHASPENLSARESPRTATPGIMEKIEEDMPGLSTPPSSCVKTPHCWSMKSFEDASPALDLGVSTLGNLWDFSDDDLALLGHSPVTSRNAVGQSGCGGTSEGTSIHTKFYNRLQQAAEMDTAVQPESGNQDRFLPSEGNIQSASQRDSSVLHASHIRPFSAEQKCSDNLSSQQFDTLSDSKLHSMLHNKDMLQSNLQRENPSLYQQHNTQKTNNSDQCLITQQIAEETASAGQDASLNQPVNQIQQASILHHHNEEVMLHGQQSCPDKRSGQETIPQGRRSCPADYHYQEAVPQGRRSCPVDYLHQDSHTVPQGTSGSRPADFSRQEINTVSGGRQSCPADYHSQDSFSMPQAWWSCSADYSPMLSMKDMHDLKSGGYVSPQSGLSRRLFPLSRARQAQPLHTQQHSVSAQGNVCVQSAGHSLQATSVSGQQAWQPQLTSAVQSPLFGEPSWQTPRSQPAQLLHQQALTPTAHLAHRPQQDQLSQQQYFCPQSHLTTVAPSPYPGNRIQPSVFPYQTYPTQQTRSKQTSECLYPCQQNPSKMSLESSPLPQNVHLARPAAQLLNAQQPQLVHPVSKSQSMCRPDAPQVGTGQHHVYSSHLPLPSVMHHTPVQTTRGTQYYMPHSTVASNLISGQVDASGFSQQGSPVVPHPSASPRCLVRQKPPVSASFGFTSCQQSSLSASPKVPRNMPSQFPISLQVPNNQQLESHSQRLRLPASSRHVGVSHPFQDHLSSNAQAVQLSGQPVASIPSSNARFHSMTPLLSNPMIAQTVHASELNNGARTSPLEHSVGTPRTNQTPGSCSLSSRLSQCVCSSCTDIDQSPALAKTGPSDVSNAKAIAQHDSMVFNQEDSAQNKHPCMPNFLDMSLDQPSLSDPFYVDYSVSPTKLSAGMDHQQSSNERRISAGQGGPSQNTPGPDFGTSSQQKSDHRPDVSRFDFVSPQHRNICPSESVSQHQQVSVLHFDASQHGWTSQTDSSNMSAFFDSLFESSPTKLPSRP